jgi:hypothetical protein
MRKETKYSQAQKNGCYWNGDIAQHSKNNELLILVYE